jgi:hypothetical protein
VIGLIAWLDVNAYSSIQQQPGKQGRAKLGSVKVVLLLQMVTLE